MNVRWDLRKPNSDGWQLLGNAHVPPGTRDWEETQGHNQRVRLKGPLPKEGSVTQRSRNVCLLALKHGSGSFSEGTQMAVTWTPAEDEPLERAIRDSQNALPLSICPTKSHSTGEVTPSQPASFRKASATFCSLIPSHSLPRGQLTPWDLTDQLQRLWVFAQKATPNTPARPQNRLSPVFHRAHCSARLNQLTWQTNNSISGVTWSQSGQNVLAACFSVFSPNSGLVYTT